MFKYRRFVKHRGSRREENREGKKTSWESHSPNRTGSDASPMRERTDAPRVALLLGKIHPSARRPLFHIPWKQRGKNRKQTSEPAPNTPSPTLQYLFIRMAFTSVISTPRMAPDGATRLQHLHPPGPRSCGVKFSRMPCTLSSGAMAWPRVVSGHSSPVLLQVVSVASTRALVRVEIHQSRTCFSQLFSAIGKICPAKCSKRFLCSLCSCLAIRLVRSTRARTLGMCFARMVLRNRFTCAYGAFSGFGWCNHCLGNAFWRAAPMSGGSMPRWAFAIVAVLRVSG